MRDLLTGLAIVLIVALTTALVAPYLVDWNGQRAFLEARLSHALGQKVTIGGHIDLKLLPTPYLVLDQTVIGGDDGPIRMGVRHLNLQLSVAPLLHGEFDIIEAQLREPTISVTLEPDRSLPTLPDAPAFEANFRFDRIEVNDGTIAVADPESGRTFVFDHLDFTADAPSLGGPFKASGTAGAMATRTSFRFVTTAAQKSRARAHLVIEETPAHAGLDLDGLVTLAHAGGAVVKPRFEGMLALSSHLPGLRDVAWRLGGPLTATPDMASLKGGELRIGTDDAGLSLQAQGQVDLGETVKLALSLSAKQLDIDRLSGPPTGSGTPAPPKLPDLATLRRLLAMTPAVPIDLDIKVEGATYGGAALSDLSAHLGLGGTGPQRLQAAGDGPGGSHLAIDGVRASGFDGTVALSAQDVSGALAWLTAVAPELAMTRRDLPFDQVEATGHVVVGPTGVAGTELRLTLDRSHLTGTARFIDATAARPAVLTADVQAEALDLDALPDLATLRSAITFDLDLSLDARAIKVSRVGDGELQAGHLALALTKSGRHLAVTRFRADDLGGATIAGSGSLDPAAAVLSATIDAAKLEAAADVLRRLAPGRIADAFHDRASALAPAKLKLDATFAADETGALAAARLDLDGRLAATTITAHLAPDPRQAGLQALTASADAPEGAALLGQLGFETLPLDLLGRSRLTLAASGAPGQFLDTRAEAFLGGTHLLTAGRYDLLGRAYAGSGTFAVESADLGPLLQALALAFPDMTGRLPIAMTGGIALAETGLALSDLKGSLDGTAANGALKWQWADGAEPVLSGALDLDRLSLAGLFGLSLGPNQAPAADSAFSSLPFTAGLVDPPRSALKLRARSLDLGIDRVATDASVDLGVAPNLVTLRGLTASLDGGRIDADVTLRRDGNQATLDGTVGLEGVALDLPSLRAKLTGHLEIASSGGSSLALVAGLAGSGEATLAQISIPGADPMALPRIFDAVEADDLAIDEQSVLRALDDAMTAPLDAGDRAFHLGLAAGTLRWDPADAPAPGTVSTQLEGSIDLSKVQIVQTTTEALQALPKGWSGPAPSIDIVWSGPLTAPKRSFDIGTFLNAVAARALARETARIEAYEFDIRERAFFNARLQADRRRDEDRQIAEDEARKAETARLAAEKAAADKAARLAAEKAAADKAARLAAEKAAADKAARLAAEKAAADKAARLAAEKAAADKAADEKALKELLPDHVPSGGTAPGQDPSAAGRY